MDTESTPEVLNAEGLARLMGTSVQAIRNALSRGLEGKTIPPSILLGTRRRWLKSTVYSWLRTIAKPSIHPRRVDNSHPHQQKENHSMSRTKVLIGDVVADEKDNELTIIEIDSAEDRVVVEDEDGDQSAISLEELLDDLQSGELQRIGVDVSQDD